MQGSLFGRLVGRRQPEAEPLLAEVRAAGADFRRVVYTQNRRVMISVGDGGETLRVHQCFREAPVEVKRAIGRMYAASRPAERARARSVVQRYLREIPPPAGREGSSASRRPRRVLPGDRAHLERLQVEFDRTNAEFFAGELPRVPLALSGRMRRRNGHFSRHPLEIVISRRLCAEAAAGESEQTLRHEMIHLWQHVQGKRPDHGPEFRRWAHRLSVHPRATRTVEWKQ